MNSIIAEDLKNIVSTNLTWQQFEGKTVLISGANGFLPAYIVETLLFLNDTLFREKAKVIGVVRNKTKASFRFSSYQARDDLQLIVQDISIPIELDKKIDYIIHAASQASPKYFGVDPVGTLVPNILGTYHLLELARKKHVEGFLYFSSGEVYGRNDELVAEGDYGYLDPTDIRSCYAESKRMGETMCVSWLHQFAVPAKIVRPFHTYGPGMSLDDGRVFADFVADIINNRNIVIKSDGKARRAFCYLADAVTGFFTILLNGENGHAYNVGNDQSEVSISELAEKLVNLFPEKGLKVVKQEFEKTQGYIKSGLSRHCPNISKIRDLGWQPKISIEEGFSRTIRSFL